VSHVCMARLNVYVPDELAARARKAGLNVSALTQRALTGALAVQQTDAWLSSLPKPGATPVAVDDVLAAIDEARDELGAPD
jgi:post-segregation antitoxin (ccd killing protein)